MTTHHLKTEKVYWIAAARGLKKFEVRKNDRAFQPGDTVMLYCLADTETEGRIGMSSGYENRNGYYTMCKDEAAVVEFTIGWMLTGGQHGLEPGYVAFSLDAPKEA